MTTTMSTSYPLPQLRMPASPYVAYAYSYPHKTAYRPLRPPKLLKQVWEPEKKDALFMYIHIPFCEMRCGFCNLFTVANPRAEWESAYVDALHRQAGRVSQALGTARIARMAIGGGTPTYLEPKLLERVFEIARTSYRVTPGSIPVSVETSPRTSQVECLRVLRGFGVTRVSIGVQSFVESEVQASARAQKTSWVEEALQRIRDLAFPVLNIDLIYGLPGQTPESWLASLRAALRWQPEELYLYPLYVRQLTGLQRRGCKPDDDVRLQCYRAGRDLLLSDGYEQVSMRMFRRRGCTAEAEPIYCCQDDGMLGLGCGARSYTRRLHYSTEYAVGSASVHNIIGAYVKRDEREFEFADYGCEVNDEEARRRWAIKSLFRSDGLDRKAYGEQFGSDAIDDLPEMSRWIDEGYFDIEEGRVRPTARGLEWSDALTPMLFSESVQAMMAEFEIR